MSATYHVLANGNLSQDWSNAGLITANDDWSAVPSIVGYLGSDVTSATGADPQLLTGDGTVAVDVIANQTSTGITNGGVAEFAITDPTIALNGSGTADAPYLVVFLDTTGRSAVTLSFNARDLDASADNAVQPIAVQYRIGDTGAWTNLPSGYIADATTGPSLATQVTPVSVVLPVEAENQAQVQVRIITANAAGSDEWVGIDDILVTSSGAAAAETLSIAAAAAIKPEGQAGTTEFTFTVTRANGEGEAGATWTLTAPGGTTDDFAGPLTGTVTFAAGETEKTITIAVAGDTLAEADEGFTVTLSDPTGGAVIGTASASGTIRNDDIALTRISAVQGTAAASTLVGQTVTIEAIVVGDFQTGDGDTRRNLGGFYLQEEDADADGTALSSEGIFVFQGSLPGDVAIGDKVLVTGTVRENFGQTEISATSVTVVSSGNAAPTAAEILLPAAATTLSQNGDIQPDLEAFEGMLVTLPQTLTVTEQFQLDRFNEIKLVAGDRPAQFTEENLPDVAGYQASLAEVGARTITYDDGLNTQNQPIGNLDGFGPIYATDNAPRMGDTVTELTGVLDYQWAGSGTSGSTWRVRSVEDDANTFTDSNPRPETPPDVGGTLQVASFNVLNFFPTLNANGADTALGFDPRGANNTDEYARQLEKLLTTLSALDAEVIGLIELENDFQPGASGNAIETIVNGLNDLEGADVWSWVNPDTRFVGTDAIAVGLIYRNDAVRLAPGSAVAILEDGLIAESGRAPIAASFQDLDSNEVFTVTVNHFKSKGSAAALPGDADQGDGQGLSNATRLQQAQELVDWLATNPTGADDQDVLIIGDLNAYSQEDPIRLLEDAGYRNLEDPDAYSYVFDGLTGSLDHALATDSLAGRVTGAAAWHINADEADALDYNLDFSRDPAIFDGTVPYRTSDHDPLVVGLDLSPPEAFPLGLSSGDVDRDSAVLWAAIPVLGAVTIEWWANGETFSRTVEVTDTDVPVKIVIDGLAAGTDYGYRFTDALGRTAEGEFGTAAAADARTGFTFGVSGDWRGELGPYPAIANADERDLDLFVKLGDTIYADYESPALPGIDQATTLAEFRAKHIEVYGAEPNFWADLQAVTPILATIDDHEVINDFAGGAPAASDPRFGTTTGLVNETALYRNGLQAFGEYNAIEDRVWSGTGDARFDGRPDLYRANTYGLDAATFVLDARSFRDETLDPWNGTPGDAPRFLGQSALADRTMLGDPQLARLKADLVAADAAGVTWKFIMVPEPIQNYGPANAEDRFEGYARERTEILAFIDEMDIENVVFIAADVHGTTVNNLTYQVPGATGLGPQIALPAFEVTTGSVAFDAPFGPAVVGLAAQLGLITAQQAAVYPLLTPAQQEGFFQTIVNAQLDAFGYDRLGLTDGLAQGKGLLDLLATDGNWTATTTYGWTEFGIDAASGDLTVTTWGIPAYTEATAGGAAPAPAVVSQFTIGDAKAIEFSLAKGSVDSTALLYRNAVIDGVQDSGDLTDTTGADTGRFRQAGGDVTVTDVELDTGRTLQGMQARLDWQEPGVAVLRDAGRGGVDGVSVTDFLGAALTVKGFEAVDLALTRTQDLLLRVEDAERGSITTGAGDDTIRIEAEGDRHMRGTAFSVDAGAGDDIILFRAEDWRPGRGDTLRSDLAGGIGDDTIRGGRSDDTIDGGAGADDLSGRGGRDVFVLRANETDGDVIRDFDTARYGRGERDQLVFEGFAEDAVLANAGGDLWTIGGETFELAGVITLRASDYSFA